MVIVFKHFIEPSQLFTCWRVDDLFCKWKIIGVSHPLVWAVVLFLCLLLPSETVCAPLMHNWTRPNLKGFIWMFLTPCFPQYIATIFPCFLFCFFLIICSNLLTWSFVDPIIEPILVGFHDGVQNCDFSIHRGLHFWEALTLFIILLIS